MPIRASERARYPKNWKEISDRIRFERAGGRCECEGECREDHGGRCPRKHGDEIARAPGSRGVAKVILTTAHLNHTPEDVSDENLKAMCQRCHLRYDSRQHAVNAARTRDAKKGQERFDFAR